MEPATGESQEGNKEHATETRRNEDSYSILVKLNNFLAYNKVESRKCANEFGDLAKEMPGSVQKMFPGFFFLLIAKLNRSEINCSKMC